MDNQSGLLNNIKNNIMKVMPYGSEKYLNNSSEFFSSNTLIAKATFLMLIIILLSFLFYVGSRLVFFLLSPSETPYLIDGMKDASEMMIIPQTIADKSSKPIFRSRNEYEGIEFTYSFWIYVENLVYKEDLDYKHIFHKGSDKLGEGGSGLFGPNNCPGAYLYTGKKNISSNLLEKYPLLGLLVRLNVYHDNDDSIAPYKYYDDIHVDGIPIKKWVGVIIRVTSQNIADIYINGTLTKRHKLSNVVKQNYDNVYINMNGGFGGNMSNLKYYNYAIGTFEIDNITSSGPNLKTLKESNLEKSKPQYLSSQWYFSETDPLTQ
tara:strand:- start:571 stop:1530 length:960 start_codon:yes stop_codon:yes gene_type:complete